MSGLEMKYFVLKPAGNGKQHSASRKAMRAYAAEIEEYEPQFAKELRAWADREGRKYLHWREAQQS